MTRQYDYDIIKRLYEDDNSLLEDLPKWASLYNRTDRPWRRNRNGGWDRPDLTEDKLYYLLKRYYGVIGVPALPTRKKQPKVKDYNVIRQIWADNPKMSYAKQTEEFFKKTGVSIDEKHYGYIVRQHRDEWLKDKKEEG